MYLKNVFIILYIMFTEYFEIRESKYITRKFLKNWIKKLFVIFYCTLSNSFWDIRVYDQL